MTFSGPPPYGWTIAPRAKRDAAAIPRSAADACLTHIAERVVYNPHRLGGPMYDRWTGYHSCHVGNYRVIYRIDEENQLVRVARMEHRGRVYGGS